MRANLLGAAALCLLGVGITGMANAGSDGFLYDYGSYRLLSVPGGFNTQAFGINNAGQIVGGYQDSTGTHGFVYSGGVYTTLNDPLGTQTQAWGINDRGQIVGFLETTAGVPGPIAGAGLPGRVFAGLGMLGWRRRREKSAAG
jgi:probable HAF family extracellular repeat protein